jgi:N6-L-threonylcarbamoyladenine synthase
MIARGSSAPLVLALESSCDETAVAVLQGYDHLLVSLVSSQIEIHAHTGGVVPEVASRQHLEVLPELVRSALRQAETQLQQPIVPSAVAATSGPGLAPALLVGLSYGKGLALGWGCPFLAINHMEGHLLSPFFAEPTIPPHVALVVSGGHTLLVRVEGFRQYTIVGRTLDDAAGEAFDKAAKMLGLPYPGGVALDQLANQGNPARFALPRSMLHSGDFHFSFSGLKTAVRYLLEKQPPQTQQDKADLCASFRAAVVEVLVGKTIALLEQEKSSLLGVSGGVASNNTLWQALQKACAARGITCQRAPEGLRTDNAAMIAFVAAQAHAAGQTTGWEEEISPRLNWPMEEDSTARHVFPQPG